MKPDNNMALAIFTTVCCCLPLGIVAIVKANSVETLYLTKQYNAAMMAANEAKKWSFIGIISSIIIWAIYLLAFGGVVALGGILSYLN
ncbi:MAG: CD225/dispanin family protein [Bacteroidaceae bacterium]|nr:CD225/dispanin family protein [Bacteroidaceae bacterium]